MSAVFDLISVRRKGVAANVRNTGAVVAAVFRVLMGDKVGPRREFIEKHALEVLNLDV